MVDAGNEVCAGETESAIGGWLCTGEIIQRPLCLFISPIFELHFEILQKKIVPCLPLHYESITANLKSHSS